MKKHQSHVKCFYNLCIKIQHKTWKPTISRRNAMYNKHSCQLHSLYQCSPFYMYSIQ